MLEMQYNNIELMRSEYDGRYGRKAMNPLYTKYLSPYIDHGKLREKLHSNDVDEVMKHLKEVESDTVSCSGTIQNAAFEFYSSISVKSHPMQNLAEKVKHMNGLVKKKEEIAHEELQNHLAFLKLAFDGIENRMKEETFEISLLLVIPVDTYKAVVKNALSKYSSALEVHKGAITWLK